MSGNLANLFCEQGIIGDSRLCQPQTFAMIRQQAVTGLAFNHRQRRWSRAKHLQVGRSYLTAVQRSEQAGKMRRVHVDGEA
jgi:hypothetical protein